MLLASSNGAPQHKLHQQWLADLESFKSSLRAQGAEPMVLEYVNEAFGRLAERIEKLAR